MPEQSLREALEAAYDEAGGTEPSASSEETGRPQEDAPEPVRDTAPTEEQASSSTEPKADSSGERKRGADGKFLKKDEAQAAEVTPDQPEETTEPEPEEPVKSESRPSIKPPESWKPTAREHWTKLPAEVQQEVMRREKDIVQTLQQTAQQRKLAESFMEQIRPYEHMIRAEGRDPTVAAGELFATAALLRVGSQAQKVTLVANMIKNFGIDIEALDSALVGEQVPNEEDKLLKLIDQRLQPFQQFIGEVQQVRQSRSSKASTEVQTEIEAFSQDPKHEFFNDVREDMADILELAHKRGRNLTLKDAYDQAVQLNPSIKEVLRQRKQAEIQAKKNASSSLPASPPPQSPGAGTTGSLRGDIEAAWNNLANR